MCLKNINKNNNKAYVQKWQNIQQYELDVAEATVKNTSRRENDNVFGSKYFSKKVETKKLKKVNKGFEAKK